MGRSNHSSNLLSTNRFLPLFVTQFLGAFNDNVFKNALVIWITFKVSSVLGLPPQQAVVLCGGVFIFPFFLFSATSGQLADKYEKSFLVWIIKFAEIIIMLLAAIGFYYNQIGFLIFVLFLMGLQSTYFGPIKYSILPQHLTEEELVDGNALIESATFLAILLGTILGGVLIAVEPNGPIYVSFILVFIAVLGWIACRYIPKAPPPDPNLVVQWNPFPPTWQILKFTKKDRTVFLSILGISWFWFFGASFLSLFPSYCKDVLSTNESVVTLFLAFFSIGIGIGSIICGKLSKGQLELGLVPIGSIGMSLFALDLFFVGVPNLGQTNLDQMGVLSFLKTFSGLRISLDLLFLAIFSGFFIVPLYTLMQERADPRVRSRIIAGNNIINALFMVVSALMVGAMLAVNFSIPQIFLSLAVLNVLVAVYIYTLLPEFCHHFLSWILSHIFYRLEVNGHHYIPKKGPAVLVCNHVTFVDWLIIMGAIKRPIRFVMDHAFAKSKIGRLFFNHVKVILIAPAKENPQLMESAFNEIAETLKGGDLVCIFPEGKLTTTGEMNIFRPGIERIIRETPVPVVPMAIQGFWGSFFSRYREQVKKRFSWKFWARVNLIIGEQVLPEEAKADFLYKKVLNLRGTHL